METTEDQALYSSLERHTPISGEPADRDLAVRLYQERIPFNAVDGAFILAAARRTYRPGCDPLPPIRSLRYFLPIVREILAKPVDPGQVSYLWLRMQGKL